MELASLGLRTPPRSGAVRVAEDRPFARVGEPRQPPSAAAGVQHAIGHGLDAIEALVLHSGNNEHRAE
eukprot:15472424-Alexandrium_andersonii.AAC.1